MALTLDDRAALVLAEAWRLLPPAFKRLPLQGLGLEDLGAKHGTYDPDTRQLVLSTRLLLGPRQALPLLDIHGNDPPQTLPCVSRALHTALHELAHAYGDDTGLHGTPAWLRLSTWMQADDDPQGTGRYVERRPGWEQERSAWRYRLGPWFVREYSTKSPHEDFADCVAHVALGWHDFFATPNGQAKLAYIRREVWGATGTRAIAAASARWRARLAGVSRT